VIVSVTIAVVALLVVGISLIDFGNFRINIGLSLALIVVQASLVLGFMMHLFSERKLIYSVLGFTGFFLVFLLFLTLWSLGEVPRKPAHNSTPAVEAAK
jgi:heme/copper-type cytochrome/quinol oxidase subunit 4